MDINDRVVRLEKQNLWLKLGVGTCAAVACIAVVMGADLRDKDYGPYRSVKAQRFVVVDEAGKERGSLGIDKNGNASIVARSYVVANERGREMGSMAASKDAVSIDLKHANGKSAITLAARDGGVNLLLNDADHQKKVTAVADRNNSMLDVRNTAGVSIALATIVDENGQICPLMIYDTKGKMRFVAGFTANGDLRVIEYDKKGNPQ